MIKADELRIYGSCLNKAHHDEPVFVLRAKDPLAAQTIRLWAAMAANVHEDDKRAEAMGLAEQMDKWRSEYMSPKCEDGVQTSHTVATAVRRF